MLPMEHDDSDQDQSQTLDLIKQTLMKVIDDMTQMEADRHLPESHPLKKVAIQAEVKPEEEATETPDEESSEEPGMLDSLLGKASSADADGSMPEDQESDLPPEVADAVRKKKELQ